MADGTRSTARAKQPPRPKRGEGREALLAAVTRIVARRGIDGVTFRAVAAEAGVSLGLATYHFATREVMLQEAMTWAVRDAIMSVEPPPGEPAAFVRAAVDFVAAKPGDMTFQFETILHGTRDLELGAHVREMYERYLDAVQEWLRMASLPDDRQMAKIGLAIMDGLAFQEFVFGDTDDTRRTAELFQEMLQCWAATTAGTSGADGDGNQLV